MAQSTITSKNQTTVPKEVRARLGTDDFIFRLEKLGTPNEHWHLQWWPKAVT